MIHHRHALTSIIALALTSALVVGCSPAPEPTPTPTAAFASEEEAFAAAEETYRAYNDAFNAVDLSDPGTFERLYELSSGDFETADRETLSKLHAANYEFTGEMTVAKFRGVESDSSIKQVVAEVCIDVSKTDVVDQAGASVVNADRPAMNPLRVTFVFAKDRWLIDRADRDLEISCGSN